MLVLEEQRYIHEDLERLEQGIADRMRDEPKHVSNGFLLEVVLLLFVLICEIHHRSEIA